MAEIATGSHAPVAMPLETGDVTPALVNTLLATTVPGTVASAVRVVESNVYGDGAVSTAARMRLEIDYAPDGGGALPRDVILKLARSPEYKLGEIYANEVGFYTGLRAELDDLEVPRALGGLFDPETQLFALLLEDLGTKQASFPNASALPSLDGIRALLDTLARLHARFWDSPRFRGDLAGMQTHLEGPVAQFMDGRVRGNIQREIDNEAFKNLFVQKLGTTADEMFRRLKAVQRHQARLPQTVLHGDTHIGNTYLCGNGRGGLLDWQLTVRGAAAHDVSYLIATGVDIADRRAHERDLLRFYLDRLAAYGVSSPPSQDAMFTEYRRGMHWGLYIGWLTTPVANYGWEINILNHIRLVTAYEDLGTASLVDSLD